MEKIQEYRSKIDSIDDKIAELLDQRIDAVCEIGKIKAQSRMVVGDLGREKSIINRVTKTVEEDKISAVKQVFESMFDASRAYQASLINIDNDFGRNIDNALNSSKETFPKSAVVACQGIEGAYSQLAAERLFEVSNILYFKDWNGVFTAIEKGLCSYGILPIENSNAGSVYGVYDLILKHNFYIVRTLRMRIKHSLLAKSGTNLKDVKEIISHKQAIDQCSEYIKSLGGVKVTEVENTAVAAKMVSESDRTDIAVICSAECGGYYKLAPLARSIQNVDNNFTRFICISKNLEIYPSANKISVVLTLPHVTGSLNKLLSRFASLGLNLTKLESRPIPSSEFEFAFYFDFDGDVRKKEVRNLLAELSIEAERFSFLGCYGEVR